VGTDRIGKSKKPTCVANGTQTKTTRRVVKRESNNPNKTSQD